METQKTETKIVINDNIFFTQEEWLDLSVEQQQAYLVMRQKHNQLVNLALAKEKLFEGEEEDDFVSEWLNGVSTNILSVVTCETNPKSGLKTLKFSGATLQLLNQIAYGRFLKAGHPDAFKCYTKHNVSERTNMPMFNLFYKLAKENGDIFMVKNTFTEPRKKLVI